MGSGCSADNGGGSSHRMLEESGTVALRLAPPNLARKVSKLSLNDRRESGRPVSSPLRSDSSGEDASRKHSPSRRAVTTVPMLMVQQPGDGQRSRPVSPGRVKRDESPNTLTDCNATMGPQPRNVAPKPRCRPHQRTGGSLAGPCPAGRIRRRMPVSTLSEKRYLHRTCATIICLCAHS